jgi:hypothetical protein
MHLKIMVGQLHLVHGEWEAKAPSLLVVDTPRRGVRERDRDRLYALVEIRGEVEDRAALLQRLTATIERVYFETAGSVTGALQEALHAASSLLFQENLDAPYGGRALGGATCVVLRDGDCFIGQAGPALAYVVHKGALTRFPALSPWLDMVAGGEDTNLPALGLRRSTDVSMFRCQIEPGDTVVLAESALARYATTAAVGKAIAQQPLDKVMSALAGLSGGNDFSALVIEVVAEEAKVRRPSPQVSPVVEEEQAVAATLQQAEVRPPVEIGAPEPAKGEYAVSIPVVERPRRRGAAGEGPGALSRVATVIGHIWWAIKLPRLLLQGGKLLLGLLVFLGRGLWLLGARMLPGRESRPGERPRAGARARPVQQMQARRRNLMLGLAVVIPLLILLIAGFVYWQKGVVQEKEFAELVSGARSRQEQAAANTDPAAAGALLREALSLLDQAEAIKKEQTQVTLLRQEIEGRLDELGKVRRLAWFAELRSYDAPDTRLGRVVLAGVDVYVLDVGASRVYHHVLNEAGDGLRPDEGDPVLVRRGQQVEGGTIEGLVDMVWMQAGGGRQTSDLLILAQGGILLEYNPTWGITKVPIASHEKWQKPWRVGRYFGNFYLLDPVLGQILRYLPTSDGYTSPPQDYLASATPVDPDLIVDMAIDGNVYLLLSDGSIRKFFGGKPVSFEITGLDEPLGVPTAIYAAPDEEARHIYIADAGHKRVVQIDKEGKFVRQFKVALSGSGKTTPQGPSTVPAEGRVETAAADPFAELHGLHVDEIGGKLYFTSGNRLYMANLPAE